MIADPPDSSQVPELPGEFRLRHGARDRLNGTVPASLGQATREMGLLNALLDVSLEDVPLELQLQRALELLLASPHGALRRQGAISLVTDVESGPGTVPGPEGSAANESPRDRIGVGRTGKPGSALDIVASVPKPVGDAGLSQSQETAWQGAFCIPLRQNGKVLGVLTCFPDDELIANRQRAVFLEAAVRVLTGMIVHTRTMNRIQRLLDENRQLNRQLIALQEEEYRHLARELHDQIGQSVAVIKTEANMLSVASGRSEGQRTIQAINAEADRIYDTMHEMVGRLRPGVLDDLGLATAIEVQVAEWQRRRPALACGLDVRGTFDDLDEPVKVTVYRLVQECLTNVVRHSAATEVRVDLARSPAIEGDGTRGRVVLSVCDNGRGMDVSRMRESRGRFGLLGMRERVEGLGGVLNVESAPGRGFRLRVAVPLIERRKG